MFRYLMIATLIIPFVARADESSDLAPDSNAPMLSCNQSLDGQSICKFGSIYICEYTDPSTTTSRHTGWRWTLDSLKECEYQPKPPPPPQSLPPGFMYAPQQSMSGASSPATGSQANIASGMSYQRKTAH